MQTLNFAGLTQPMQIPDAQICPVNDLSNKGNNYIPLDNKKRSQVKSVSESDNINLNKTQEIKKEILQALSAGGDTAVLLLKACEAIAATTKDEAFYFTVKSKLFNLYGEVWKNPNINEIRLANAWTRYAALYSDEVEQAKLEHEKYIKRIDPNA